MAKTKAVTKKKASRSAAHPKAEPGIRQLVITLTASSGEIAKIEELGSAGKRRAISEAELAALAGDDDMNDLSEALEAAYAAGLQDGLEGAVEDDLIAESEASHQQRAPQTAGEQLLRAGVRRTVFRHVLRRGLSRKAVAARHNGVHDAP